MIRICFIHPIHNYQKFVRENFPEALWNSVTEDRQNPDILFASEWIYYKNECFREFQRLWYKAKIRVFYSGEALEPDMNLFDYAIGFSNKMQMGDRFVRILSPLDMFNGFISTSVNNITTFDEARVELKQKKGFCNFLYSNGNAHPMRDRLFHEISTKYKRIDSLGRHLNNVGKLGTGFSGHAAECKDIKAAYKFSIAAENATFDGYTSEKVYTSLTAHTIPIYWGNKDIAEDVNPNAIINVNDFATIDELIERIRYIDEHDNEWCRMVAEPWMTPEQIDKHRQRTEAYKDFMTYLLTGGIENKRRIPKGTHIDYYRYNVLHRVWPLSINRYNWKDYVVKYRQKIFKR